MISLILSVFLLLSCGPVKPITDSTVYWQEYCTRLVQPIAPLVCETTSEVNLSSCVESFSSTFTICNMSAAQQYLNCAIDANDFGCLDNNNSEFPWVVDYSNQCTELMNTAFDC